MKNVVIKVLLISIIIFSIFTVITPVNAEGIQFSWSDVFSDASGFIEKGKESGEGIIPVSDISNTVIPIARGMITIATVVLLVVTIIMAIKYMMASPDGRAKLKVQLIGLVVSTMVIFGAQVIWSIVYTFMNNLTD